MKRLLPLLAVFLLARPVASAAPAAEPFAPDRVRLLSGPLKDAQELHRTGLVGQLDPDRMLFPFRRTAGLPQPPGVTRGYGGWDDGFIAGHYGGHYLSAASRMFAATGDATFRDKVSRMVAGLAECQQKLGTGYLSAFPVTKIERLEKDPRQGSVAYYTIHKILAGLIDAHTLCGNEDALDIAARMSDYFAGRIAKLTPAQIEAMLRTDYTANPANEFGGMAEAISELYLCARRRGDPDAGRHLRLAEVFNRDWFIDPLLRGEDRLDGLHGNTHAAQASAFAVHALATGDTRTARAADAFWRLVTRRHSFVNGANSFHEKLRAPGVEVAGAGPAELNALTAESCNTHNMLKLARSLFALDPRAEYADYAENALFNHLLATIEPDHGRVVYFLPLRSGHFRVHLDEPYCCLGTGIENAARFGDALYFHRGDQLWVTLYAASTLDWREQGLTLRVDTRYPDDGRVRITVDAARETSATLHLRIPAWLAGAAVLKVNGAAMEVAASAGSFASLTRVWKSGDVVELNLPFTLRTRPASDDPATVSLFYGPLLLAGELGRERMPADEIGGNMDHSGEPPVPAPVFVSATPERPNLRIERAPGDDPVWTARMFDPRARREIEVRLAPFHRVHHQRYAVYWQVLTEVQAAVHADQIARASADAGFIGDSAAEKALDLRGEKTTSGRHQGRAWRDASNGGWFSYRMQVDSAADLDLVCTYWGGDGGNRVFDLFMDDVKVGEQTLRAEHPGAFFDVAYRVPAERVRGRQFVVVKFHARPGAQAGGVFGCRFAPIKP